MKTHWIAKFKLLERQYYKSFRETIHNDLVGRELPMLQDSLAVLLSG